MTTNIFDLNRIDDVMSDQINIDELYNKKRQRDIDQLNLFNKVLHRVHLKIKQTSQKSNYRICWYVVPELILGATQYDQPACIAFLINKLQINGFRVRYIHPNLLCICWDHWIPEYVRSQIKKTIGVEIDPFGEQKNKPKEISFIEQSPSTTHMNDPGVPPPPSKSSLKTSSTTKYIPISNYKPSGKIYGDILDSIQERMHNK